MYVSHIRIMAMLHTGVWVNTFIYLNAYVCAPTYAHAHPLTQRGLYTYTLTIYIDTYSLIPTPTLTDTHTPIPSHIPTYTEIHNTGTRSYIDDHIHTIMNYYIFYTHTWACEFTHAHRDIHCDTHTHTHMQPLKCTYISHTKTCPRTYTHTLRSTRLRIYKFTPHPQTHTYPSIHPHVHLYIYTETRKHIHTYIYIHSHSYMVSQTPSWITSYLTHPHREHLKNIIFTNPSARVGYESRSIFKRSLIGLNSEFSFS